MIYCGQTLDDGPDYRHYCAGRVGHHGDHACAWCPRRWSDVPSSPPPGPASAAARSEAGSDD